MFIIFICEPISHFKNKRWSFSDPMPGRVSAGHRAEASLTAAGGSSLSRDISRFLGFADL